MGTQPPSGRLASRPVTQVGNSLIRLAGFGGFDEQRIARDRADRPQLGGFFPRVTIPYRRRYGIGILLVQGQEYPPLPAGLINAKL